MGSRNSAKVILLAFLLGALCDFVLVYVERRSVAEGVISAVLGLFGTAWLFLGSEKDTQTRSSDDPRELGQWVP